MQAKQALTNVSLVRTVLPIVHILEACRFPPFDPGHHFFKRPADARLTKLQSDREETDILKPLKGAWMEWHELAQFVSVENTVVVSLFLHAGCLPFLRT